MAVAGRQNQLEYFLQGSVGKESVDTLLHRLRGLCDGASRQSATFVDHEMLYTLGNERIIFTLALNFGIERYMLIDKLKLMYRSVGNFNIHAQLTATGALLEVLVVQIPITRAKNSNTVFKMPLHCNTLYPLRVVSNSPTQSNHQYQLDIKFLPSGC